MELLFQGEIFKFNNPLDNFLETLKLGNFS
jgi:hypothetical protein